MKPTTAPAEIHGSARGRGRGGAGGAEDEGGEAPTAHHTGEGSEGGFIKRNDPTCTKRGEGGVSRAARGSRLKSEVGDLGRLGIDIPAAHGRSVVEWSSQYRKAQTGSLK